jgi:hypothetical protein
MAGQEDVDRDDAGTLRRDGLIADRAGRTTNPLVGAPPTTMGGGGGNGGFFFTNTSDLDEIIKRLSALRRRVWQRGLDLRRVIGVVTPPAHDPASRRQADATRRSLDQAYAHNTALGKELASYVQKFHQAKAVLVDTDSGNAGRLTRKDGG